MVPHCCSNVEFMLKGKTHHSIRPVCTDFQYSFCVRQPFPLIFPHFLSDTFTMKTMSGEASIQRRRALKEFGVQRDNMRSTTSEPV